MEWKPSSKAQEKALSSSVYELLYGGAAGGGKSEFLLIDAAKQVKKPKYRGILMRNSFPELERSLIIKSMEYYPHFGGKYNSQLHRWRFPSGAIIDFGYSENDIDIQKYKSAEYAYIGIDESTTFSEYQINYIISRNRCPVKNIKKRIRMATNPTGKSHAWHKKRFIEGKTPYVKYKDSITDLDYMFIPALASENKILMAEDPDYVKKLRRLPEKEQKALLYGSWDIFEGQYFTEWDSRVHVCEAHEIPPTWQRFISVDYGYTQPSAVYWYAVSPDGQLIVYRELWGTGFTYEDLAKQITQLMSYKEKPLIEYCVLDPSLFFSKSGEKTCAEVFNKHGLYSVKGNNARLVGWNFFREALKVVNTPQGKKTGIIFFNHCKHAIRTIPGLMHDDKKPEDLDTRQKDENGLNMDDTADSIRYGIASRFTSRSENKDKSKNFHSEMRKFKSGKKKIIP